MSQVADGAQLTSGLEITLQCPSCGGWCAAAREYACDRCGTKLAVSEGDIPSLTGHDDFYEHQCTETLRLPLVDRIGWPWRGAAYLDFLCNERHRRNRFFRRVVERLPRRDLVLDVGCGGGMAVWRQLGRVVGLSNSLTGLRKARQVYDGCVHADLNHALPFPEASFDYVVASDIVGHFDDAGRDRLLQDIRRCLRPGGRFIAVIETIGRWLEAYERRYPGISADYIAAGVRRAGHIGLEAPRQALARLARQGFVCEQLELLGAYPGYVEGFFTPEFERFPAPTRWHALAKTISRVVRRNGVAMRVTDNIFGVINTVNLRRLGVDWADGLMVVCRVAGAADG